MSEDFFSRSVNITISRNQLHRFSSSIRFVPCITTDA